MISVLVIIGMIIAGAIISGLYFHPALTILAIAGIAFLFYTLAKKSENNKKLLSKSKNETYIKIAIREIEKAYEIGIKLKKSDDILGHVTMWEGNKDDLCAFCIQLCGSGDLFFYNEEYFRESHNLYGNHISISVDRNERNTVINISQMGKVYGEWNHFNQEVWNELRSKHPDWRIEAIYPYKTIVNF